ncbi:MAG: DUF1963 domain-containing protein [Planctomycetales bacterium]|nr:DUF1963 domain-containing protein [Planctomycetales bacterium]
MDTKFLPASTDPDEIQWIMQLASDFSSCDAYRQYALWLDKRDRQKADFIRAVERAFFDHRDAGSFPTPSSDDEVWLNSIGFRLLSGILELNLLSATKTIFTWTRPIVTIRTVSTDESSLPVGTSKFGGRPDVPDGFVWPKCNLGPMGFMGQIAFKDIRHSQATARFGLPADGLLLLFVFQGDGVQPGVVDRHGDHWREIEGLTRGIFVNGGTRLHRHTPEVELDEWNELLPCCALHMADGLDLPEAKDTEDAVLIAADEDWQVSDLRNKINQAEHWLMGYPVHGRTDNTSPGKDWTGLITLGSDNNLGWNWCDGEHLDVYIQRDSIIDGTFASIYGYAS